jgi:CRP-like cAMP-binding protein
LRAVRQRRRAHPRRLAAALRVRRFRKAETIFHQGDPGDALFIVASGTVKVVLPSDEGAEPAIVAVLGAGEFFGELAILDGAPHSATIVAIEPTETLVLHRDEFLALIDSEPELRRALLASLATEIRRLTGHVEDLHFSTCPAASHRGSCGSQSSVSPIPTARSGSPGRTPSPSWPA